MEEDGRVVGSVQAVLSSSKLKPLVFAAALTPLLWIGWQLFIAQSSPDPAKSLVDASGIWALRLLWLCLLLTPLKYITGISGWIKLRRMLGLFAFFYACIHFLSYWFLLFGGELAEIVSEIAERPYVLVGLVAFLMLVPLAVTSSRSWQRRLRNNWVRLHQLIYLIAILALIHFTWVQKLGLRTTAFYAVSLLVMLGIRVVYRVRHKPN